MSQIHSDSGSFNNQGQSSGIDESFTKFVGYYPGGLRKPTHFNFELTLGVEPQNVKSMLHGKPPITVLDFLTTSSETTDQKLASLISVVYDQWTTVTLDLDVVLLFLYQMSPQFSQTLDKDWVSYKVKIGAQGESVHPFSLQETTIKADNRGLRKSNFSSRMEEAYSLVGMILTLYRLGRLGSSEIMADYVTQIINKANSVFVGKPWSAKSLGPQLNVNSLTCSSWWNNRFQKGSRSL
ncbi:nucleoprotein [Biomphalaria pfeifferi]|uniref:Nucleoprotein n=1 Tax=Biomphalaria pfeifferi TaxID=112525 RepID=A0AAD8BDU6_BIOPF|nr:nucleoprotein [Biomphalaria pfeifferi]